MTTSLNTNLTRSHQHTTSTSTLTRRRVIISQIITINLHVRHPAHLNLHRHIITILQTPRLRNLIPTLQTLTRTQRRRMLSHSTRVIMLLSINIRLTTMTTISINRSHSTILKQHNQRSRTALQQRLSRFHSPSHTRPTFNRINLTYSIRSNAKSSMLPIINRMSSLTIRSSLNRTQRRQINSQLSLNIQSR